VIPSWENFVFLLVSLKKKKGDTMAKYQCMCGWIYDEEKGEPSQNIAPNTKFEDLPDTFKCPQCGLGKNAFRKL